MNIIARIRARVSEFAALPAVIEGEFSLTHAQLWERVDRLSNALHGLGVRKGNVLMAWLPNCHEAIEAELACLQSGVIWVTVNTRFTWNEVAEILTDCQPKIFVTDEKHLGTILKSSEAETFSGELRIANYELRKEEGEGDKRRSKDGSRKSPELAGRRPVPRLILTGTDRQVEGELLSYESLIAQHGPDRPRREIADEDIARLRYTSGTTGKAKAAIVPHRVYLASLKNLQAELHPLDTSDRVLHAAPLTHASGAIVFPILAAGGANVIISHFDPELVLETVEKKSVTTMFIVPTIIQRLTTAAGFKTHDLSSLRTIMYGGAPTAIEKLNPLMERLGPALVHIFGMTEAPYPITTLKREEHWIGNPKLGSIGKPTAICKLKILDDTGHELGENETGELWVSGENVMAGYWNDPEETRKVLKDGWLATGDLARRDEDGYYWIVDRKKDVIISGGFNVYAKEVEAVLCSHESIAEAAVVGRPHPEWGETVVACVVPREGVKIDPEEIRRWCHERLTGYKCPKKVEILSELPKNASGKILKKELAVKLG